MASLAALDWNALTIPSEIKGSSQPPPSLNLAESPGQPIPSVLVREGGGDFAFPFSRNRNGAVGAELGCMGEPGRSRVKLEFQGFKAAPEVPGVDLKQNSYAHTK
ncbi:hypothetical protein PRK78_006880 [Emydomyces testavorans]|uniref:Uncharacterized protein n=1 Tax=Emydomyces testavorans TaxID=2070801 RepID=A0AAF0IKX8_9EURO|nr:hypothetical protein PRK78_006880 [Emydomyces testavorans]